MVSDSTATECTAVSTCPVAPNPISNVSARNVQDLFHHVLAVLHDSTYNQVNADALRAEGPRIPLLGWPDGEAEGAAEALAQSAGRGRDLARLLDPENASAWRHPRRVTPGDRDHRRARHDGRAQHGGRRFRVDGWMGGITDRERP